MNFKFDKHGISKYTKLLQKRINKVRETEIKLLLTNLYNLSPKITGRLASNYYCTVNTNNAPYDENKFTPTFNIPNFTINDQVFIVNNTPYINFVNYGTIHQLPQNFIEHAITVSNLQLLEYIKEIGNSDF